MTYVVVVVLLAYGFSFCEIYAHFTDVKWILNDL